MLPPSGSLSAVVEAYSHEVPVRWVLFGVVLLAVVGTVYVRIQLRERYPMLPFDLLKIPIFSMSVATSILSFTAQMICMIAMPFLLVNTFHYDAVGTGLLMTSWPLGNHICRPIGWGADREDTPRNSGRRRG